MAETASVNKENAESGEDTARIYEVGYVVAPIVKEEDVEKIVGSIRTEIEKAGGNFIAEGAPSMIRLTYPMAARSNDKNVEHDRGYFGWLKFEAGVDVARTLEEALKKNQNIMRCIIFRTVREDTRAKMKAPQLREVKRTDTIKTTARRVEESTGPVSEEDLEKALQDITTD